MPKKIAEKFILKRILDRVYVDVDRNIGRIRYDLLRRIEESFSEFEKDMNLKLQSMFETVKKLLAKTKADYELDKDSFEKEKVLHQDLLKNIRALQGELNDVLKND